MHHAYIKLANPVMKFLTNMQMLSTNVRIILTSICISQILNLSAQDFEVAPVLVSFDANPGEIQNKALTIRNHSNRPQNFILGLSDYLVNSEGGKKAQAAGSTDRTLADWITINPSLLELNPNESGTVELIMNVPRTGFNTRWGMVRVELAKEQEASQADKQLSTGVIIVPRIVVLVKQSPRSNLNYKGTVSDLREIENDQSELKSFEATLTNTGDKILDAKVYLALANLETAEEIQYTPTRIAVYPEQQRKVILSLPDEPDPGQYALAFLMDYGHKSAIEGAQILLTIE